MKHTQPHFQGYVQPVRLTDTAARRSLYVNDLPLLTFERNPDWHVPSDEECFALWDKYHMPENIRAHSSQVARLAVAVSEVLRESGADVHVPSVRAAALLHDIGKYFTILHGGSHGQVGAAWVMRETRNPHIAQAVLQHVRWMWDVDASRDCWLLSFCIIYADKRVMHDKVVSLQERYEDLLVRYGHTDDAKRRIDDANKQGQEIEVALSGRTRIPLHEYTLDSGRLVKRA